MSLNCGSDLLLWIYLLSWTSYYLHNFCLWLCNVGVVSYLFLIGWIWDYVGEREHAETTYRVLGQKAVNIPELCASSVTKRIYIVSFHLYELFKTVILKSFELKCTKWKWRMWTFMLILTIMTLQHMLASQMWREVASLLETDCGQELVQNSGYPAGEQLLCVHRIHLHALAAPGFGCSGNEVLKLTPQISDVEAFWALGPFFITFTPRTEESGLLAAELPQPSSWKWLHLCENRPWGAPLPVGRRPQLRHWPRLHSALQTCPWMSRGLECCPGPMPSPTCLGAKWAINQIRQRAHAEAGVTQPHCLPLSPSAGLGQLWCISVRGV